MSAPQKMKDNVKGHVYCSIKATAYNAPTPGLEHIVVEYGKWMKPGNFKTMMESMAKHMAGALKRGGKKASKAINKVERQSYKEPTGPVNGSRNDHPRFDFDEDRHMKQEANWEEMTGVIFEKFSSHCASNMKTKLRGMSGWETI